MNPTEIITGLAVLALLALTGYIHHIGLDIAYELLADQILRAAAAAAHELRCRAKARRTWRKALEKARTPKRIRVQPSTLLEEQKQINTRLYPNENLT